MFVALPAPLAYAATVCLPAHTHSVACFPVNHAAANRYNRPHNLMARDEWILAESPIVIDQVNVAMAYPTVRDLDLHLVCLQLTCIVFVRQQMRTGRVHSQTMDLIHWKSSFRCLTSSPHLL